MYRSNSSPTRIIRGLVVLVTAAALAGCADSSAPVPPGSRHPIIIIGGQPVVFTAQLRAIGNPDTKPPTAVEGHLLLKIEDGGETGLLVNWNATIVNPECESSRSFGGGIYMIQDSEDFPSPEDDALLYLLSPEKTLGCGDNLLDGSVGISEELAARLIGNPDTFTAVFFLTEGGALAGALQLGGPDTTPTR